MERGRHVRLASPGAAAGAAGALGLACALALAQRPAAAIPAFARRYETSCSTCHQVQFPRLNPWGRAFRDAGYQLPGGAEDRARARRTVEPGTTAERLSVFKEVPIGVRGEVLGDLTPERAGTEEAAFDQRVVSYVMGGGSVSEGVSAFFSWSPFPDPTLHHFHLGAHDVGASVIGEGTLNLRAGVLFLLDFAEPSHRAPAPSVYDSITATVGGNGFSLDGPNPGLLAYGRPGAGPLHYEVGLFSGDLEPGTFQDRDGWKDGWARVEATPFRGTGSELRPAAFGYLGRSEFETDLGGVQLRQRDDFWVAGGDLAWGAGRFSLHGLGYLSRHADAHLEGEPVSFGAFRVEPGWSPWPRLAVGVPYERVWSAEDHDLEAQNIAPRVTASLATNALVHLAWKLPLHPAAGGTATAAADFAF